MYLRNLALLDEPVCTNFCFEVKFMANLLDRDNKFEESILLGVDSPTFKYISKLRTSISYQHLFQNTQT